mgnify:CR=1 FL=1
MCKLLNTFQKGSHKDSGSVLVHCAGGVSRSSAIVLAYLVGKHNMSLWYVAGTR